MRGIPEYRTMPGEIYRPKCQPLVLVCVPPPRQEHFEAKLGLPNSNTLAALLLRFPLRQVL